MTKFNLKSLTLNKLEPLKLERQNVKQLFTLLIHENVSIFTSKTFSQCLPYLFQNIGVFIGFSWFGSVTMYAVLLLPEKLYEFDLKGTKVSFMTKKVLTI